MNSRDRSRHAHARRPDARRARRQVLATACLIATPVAGQQPAALARYDLERDRGFQARLPRDLNEVSGLAWTDDRLFGHGDERGIVFAIDPVSGAATLAYAPGERGVRGDFEGVAIAEGRMYLVTSTGALVSFGLTAGGTGVPYETHDGLAERNCEVEGLEYDAASRSLLLACKTTRGKTLDDHLVVFAWSLERRAPVRGPRWAVPFAELERVSGDDNLNPSGIAIHPITQTVFILAGRQKRIVEMARDGTLLATRNLPGRNHAQPEGIAFLPDGTLLIADEAAGGRATITRYPMRAQ